MVAHPSWCARCDAGAGYSAIETPIIAGGELAKGGGGSSQTNAAVQNARWGGRTRSWMGPLQGKRAPRVDQNSAMAPMIFHMGGAYHDGGVSSDEPCSGYEPLGHLLRDKWTALSGPLSGGA